MRNESQFKACVQIVATKLADAGANTRTISSIIGRRTREQIETYVVIVNKKTPCEKRHDSVTQEKNTKVKGANDSTKRYENYIKAPKSLI